MIGKTLLALGVLAALLLPLTASGGSAPPATVTITATVDAYAEWASTTPAINAAAWDGHFNATNQTRTAHVDMTLYTNVDTTITPTKGTNNSVLTNGAATLATSYKVTGTTTGAAGFLSAGTDGTGAFFTANTYGLTHALGTGSYTITLHVQAVGPLNAAPNSGDYTCDVVLTASW